MSHFAKGQKTTTYMAQDLDGLVELLSAIHTGSSKVALYEDLARRLSKLANQNHGKPWSWRYVQSVHRGTLGHAPSKRFAHAVQVLAATMDGTPPAIADSEPVTIYARKGSIHPGALIEAKSQRCKYPPCSAQFVKTHPMMEYCPVHREPGSRK